ALLGDTAYAIDVPWRAEVDAARRARADAEAASRLPDALSRFHRKARAELGAASVPLLAERTERAREDWLRQHLVTLGRARAQALGWPDAYAYTKALGERALLERGGGLPLTIVRPSIIESALADPHPGWIRGFRMAEPVIISYARGLLREFPGLPEGVVDVIPVDLVVAALITVAASGPDPAGPSVYHVASGARNPLRYRRLVDLVRDYFGERPIYDADGQPILVPEWSFPGRGRVQRQLQHYVRALRAAERVVGALPIRGEQAAHASRIEERRALAERALDYVQLYGAYTETEAAFGLDRLIALWSGLDEADQRDFCFDPAAIDWPRYLHEVHLPSVVAQARVRTTGPRKAGGKAKGAAPAPEGWNRAERARLAVLAPERHIAFFDLENTLIASNVVESYSWLATRHMADGERARFTARMLREAPSLLTLDRRDRGDFLRHFYRRYDGASAHRLRADSRELFSSLILTKSFPAGIRRVREHRALGHRTVLITGALDFVVDALRPLFDDVICARLGQDGDRLTGELLEAPPTGEARALIMADCASAARLSMAEAVAYADSTSDLPMLEAVGYPVAVNPEAKLAAIARKRGWHVEQWSKAPGAPRPLLPIAPRLAPGSAASHSPVARP
ncbi:MAG: HAD-IB family phosphatase, partial [Acidimicrobiales bacterium]